MKFPRLRTVLLTPIVIFAAFYVYAAVWLALDDDSLPVLDKPPAAIETIAIFGATGTAGDGILKAALTDPDIHRILVFTRRMSPRIEAGVAAGKVQASIHTDYLDYAPIREQLREVDAVFWAIGISSLGVDEETYGRIHVDFPMRFVADWLTVSERDDISFHYISSSDISAESSAMWAREKVRAENSLIGLAAGKGLRVICYRPDYIGPTAEEAHLGQDLLYWFFAPVKSAIRARQIGQAMIEVTARGTEFGNGDRLHTRSLLRLSDAYELRQNP